ncbi:MAG: bifunctional (p)ppGpp synthetase/guanosine-3',5'-bis(diphosphate) 3'-pyrophosphohydrolase [Bacilli bacterium]|nr:bifunctional (p)ppGpp synthetase/guanosine-3',5'-bis(diphosphate) 3'-pyrophosphohydrolase [Bacilli bacterium]
MNIRIDDLLELVGVYKSEGIEVVKKAYDLADKLHEGQFRQSGEPYIIHPLNVAYILAEMHADIDTIVAGLLHDTLEDTNIRKEEIAQEFNSEVANLVDGVTKISKLNFSNKVDENMANTRKIITGITEDVRIIIIKLADRLHNMRTLQYKKPIKQKENALETIEIFVPLAYYIGAYRIKTELEDLSLYYLKPDMYKTIEEKKLKIELDNKELLLDMSSKIKKILSSNNIPNDIKIRTKNIYGIYRRLSEGHKLSDIHDLLSLKIMVDSIDSCYRTLGMIHKEYHSINENFKDFIWNPKTNMYRSLHTTVFGPDNKLVQAQIRTFNMDKVASFGLCTYWEINNDNARNIMQKELKEKYQFFKSLIQINSMFGDNQEFVNQVKKEVFSDNVYVYTPKGEVIELPIGSTVIDFAYKIHTDIGNTMVGAIVNDEHVSAEYVLKNKDRVFVLTDDLSFGPRDNWLDVAHTSLAKKKIKEFSKR